MIVKLLADQAYQNYKMYKDGKPFARSADTFPAG